MNNRIYSNEFDRAYKWHLSGKLKEAESSYAQLLARDPDNGNILQLMGALYIQTGRFREAIHWLESAIKHLPPNANAVSNLGTAYKNIGNIERALELYEKSLSIDPKFVEAANNLGTAFFEVGRYEDSIRWYTYAIKVNNDDPQSHFNIANAFAKQGNLVESIAAYERSLALNPSYAEAHNNLGITYKEFGKLKQATSHCKAATEIKDDYFEAHNNLAICFEELRDYVNAIKCYRKAVALVPTCASATCQLLHQLQHVCDWQDTDSLSEQIRRFTFEQTKGETAVAPFSFLSLPRETNASEQHLCASRWASRRLTVGGQPIRHLPRKSEILRVGFLSADFRDHPVSALIAEVFESFDRSRFHWTGYSYGPDDRSPIRQRISNALSDFKDIRSLSFAAAASQIRNDQIDILVDLTGYTQHCRTEILALRPAPIQVNYLGYPGTLGASFMDYILVDEFVVPEDQQPFFTEKLVHLPGCYQANDSKRSIAPTTPSRAQCGLPDSAFVFCCFNNNYKITPRIFDSWMRILTSVPGSVLWLLEGNSVAPNNLRREALKRGVSPDRLVFAPRASLPDHLARHRLADLFLDTFPYNAHTTASDALWAGLPLLTLAGSTFASRVAGSLLTALGIPQLITNSFDAYETRAVHLAKHPQELNQLRASLSDALRKSDVFNGQTFVRHLELAFERMWQIYADGSEPQGFRVPPICEPRKIEPQTSKKSEAHSSKNTNSMPNIQERLTLAVQLHQQERLSEAEALYREILRAVPSQADALHLLGVSLSQRGKHSEAEEFISKAIKAIPENAIFHDNLGTTYKMQNKLAEAKSAYMQAIQRMPNYAQAHNNLGLLLKMLDEPSESLKHFSEAIRLNPKYAEAHFNLGNYWKQLNQPEKAEESYRSALAIRPNYCECHNNLGILCKEQERYPEAIAQYLAAIQVKPSYSEAYRNLGNALVSLEVVSPYLEQLQQLANQVNTADAWLLMGIALSQNKQHREAIQCYEKAININPNLVEAWKLLAAGEHKLQQYSKSIAAYEEVLKRSDDAECKHNLGLVLLDSGRHEDAVRCYEQLTQVNQTNCRSYNNLGNAYQRVGRFSDAIAAYKKAIDLDHNYAEAANNLGTAFTTINDHENAIAAYQQALRMNPLYARAYNNLGTSLQMINRLDDALASFQKAVQLDADYLSAATNFVYLQQHTCNWIDLISPPKRIKEAVKNSARYSMSDLVSPFSFLALPNPTSHEEQQLCAICWGTRKFGILRQRQPNKRRANDSALRVGFLSADFRDHPVSALIAEVFESFDRSRFHWTGYSYGPDDRSPIRQRISNALSDFKDIRSLSFAAAASQIRNDQIDILVDLTGYTQHCRTEILALRPAPIQVNYLGYPGTLGASFMDYILVDEFVVPEDQQPFFTEKLVHLPGCYQANDSKRSIAPTTPSRAQCGLPDSAFVFCCFNNNYKITPRIFDSWMRILTSVPGSVLWLLEGNSVAPNNLRREALKRGVSPDRLVFAPRASLPDHLARHRLADLFLDTFPYNAHTTASDALWAGLPLLTLAGSTFASRVAGSLLTALGIPQLITNSFDAYETRAVHLAKHPQELNQLRASLSDALRKSDVFNGQTFVRHLELAFERMWQIYADGSEPQGFRVPPICEPRKIEPQTSKKSEAHSSKNTNSMPNIQERLTLAVQLHQQERLSEAEALYREILRAVPSQADALHLLGVSLSQRGKHSEAEEFISKAIKAIPENAIFHDNLGTTYKMQNKLAEAKSAYMQAIQRMPNYAQAHNNLGLLLKMLDEPSESLKHFSEAIRLNPKYAEAHFNLGNYWKQLNQPEKAEESYRSALAIRPNYCECHNNLGILCKEQERYPEAIAQYLAAIQVKPSYSEAYRNLGNALVSLEVVSPYLEQLQQLANQVNTADAWLLMGIALSQNKQHREAIQCYEKAININPNLVEAYCNKTSSHLELDQLGEALSVARTASQIDDCVATQLNFANVLLKSKNYADAVKLLKSAILTHPLEPLLHKALGNAMQGLGQTSIAIQCYSKAIELNPQQPELQIALGTSYQINGEYKEASKALNECIRLHPYNAEALNGLGNLELNQGNLDAAEKYYRQGLVRAPKNPTLLTNLANLFQSKGEYERAIEVYDQALKSAPRNAFAMSGKGFVYMSLKRLDEAIEYYLQAIKTEPKVAQFYNNLGIAYQRKGDLQNAAASFQKCVELDPKGTDSARALTNLGLAFKSLNRLDEAMASYLKALEVDASYRDARFNLANLQRQLGDLKSAKANYQKTIDLHPDFAEAYNNFALTNKDLGDRLGCIHLLQAAIKIRPDYVEAWNNLGVELQENKQLTQAIECYSKAIQINPQYSPALSQLVHQLQHVCDWNDIDDLSERLDRLAIAPDNHLETSPFSYMALPTIPSCQKQLICARKWVARKFTVAKKPSFASRIRNDRLTVGFLSADFRDHPVSTLLVETLENTDRSRLKFVGYSYGKKDRSGIRERIVGSFEEFREINHLKCDDACKLIGDDRIDILVDLTGYTQNCRTEILAARPAPIQVNFLGYPGTMGADFIDYIIADEFLIPPSSVDCYSEHIVYMPHCYQPNDSRRVISESIQHRSEYGLPEDALVFCCFNNSYKITRQVFDVWMKLLREFPDSVLWLLEGNTFVAPNLKKEAEKRGINGERILFAPRATLPVYLARHQLADLFLDTFPYAAHTTASDALWAGLPIVTLAGDAFSSRVAGSLLNSLGFQDLIAYSISEYFAKILEVASDRGSLCRLKKELKSKVTSSPVFSGSCYSKHLERALFKMWENYQIAGSPNHIWVNAD